MDWREIRFDSEAEGGKIGIIPQICGKYWVWKEKKGVCVCVCRGGFKNEKEFCKGRRRKAILLWHRLCWMSRPLHPTLCSPLHPSSPSPQRVKDPINNSQSQPDTHKTTGRCDAAVPFQCCLVRAPLYGVSGRGWKTSLKTNSFLLMCTPFSAPHVVAS